MRRADSPRGRRRAVIVLGIGLAMLVPKIAGVAGAAVVAPVLTPATVDTSLDDTLKDSLLVTDKEYQGWKWFHVYCFRCHGVDAMGGTFAPNLRHSVGPEGSVTHDVFIQTVTNGRLAKGMPTWKALLDSSQIEELYSYVTARSSGRLIPGRPHRVGEQ